MPPAQITRPDREQLYELDRRSSAVPQIYDRLRQLIVELRLRPRERLSKAELAKRFGISETPVREALLRLEEEGLVVIKPQSGTYVAPIDVERASEARFLRVSVEIEVVKQLCNNIDEDRLSELRSILTLQRFLCTATIGKASRARTRRSTWRCTVWPEWADYGAMCARCGHTSRVCECWTSPSPERWTLLSWNTRQYSRRSAPAMRSLAKPRFAAISPARSRQSKP